MNTHFLPRTLPRHWPLVLAGLCALLIVLVVAAPSDEANDQRQHLRVGVQLEPPNLDPTSGAAGAIDQIVYANIFEGLTRMAEDGTVVPGLAERWTVSDDGLRWRFFLRRNVRFHDGTHFDADDVVFTLERARGPGSSNAQQLQLRRIKQVIKIDPFTAELRLDAPFPVLATVLAWGDSVIVAPESADQNAVSPVGTGAFRFDHWQRSSAIHLVNNPEYWGERAKLDGVTFRIIPDPAVAYAALIAGDIDVFPGYPAPENFAQLVNNARFGTAAGLTQGETILALNHRNPALSDLTVRRALTMAIDRGELIEGAMFGLGAKIGSHYPPTGPDYVDLTQHYAYDREQAKSMLEGAGFGPDTPLRLRLLLPPPTYARRSGEIVAAQLRALNIDVRVENIEWAQWINRVFIRHDFDLTIVAHTEPDDLDIYARPGYYFGYESPTYQALAERLHAEADIGVRSEIVKQMQRQLADDAVNVFLFQLPQLSVFDQSIKGLWKEAPLQAIDVTSVYKDVHR